MTTFNFRVPWFNIKRSPFCFAERFIELTVEHARTGNAKASKIWPIVHSAGVWLRFFGT